MRDKYSGLLFHLGVAALVLLGSSRSLAPLPEQALAGEDGKRLSKAEKIIKMRERNKDLFRTNAFRDRKIGRMDNGQMVMYYDNNGFIGDRDFTRSIEWPAGTLNYLVWQTGIVFGAVTANGDTISSESYNDISDNQFNPEPGFDNPDYTWPVLETAIVARSDIRESFAPSWNGLWPGIEGRFIDPNELKNLARQESYWVMRDDNDPEVSAEPPLHIEAECRLIQINSSLTKDFIFAIYKVKNVSGARLSNCRFGVLVDPDMPALVGAEFEDDDDGFIKDLNLAFARDTDNFYASKPGLNIGHFGVKFLKSPVVNGEELGLTSWTTFEYGDMPAPGEFIITEDGPDENLGTFRSRDHAQYQYMQPGIFMQPQFNTDVAFMMASGDFDLEDGESVDIAVAFIAAPDFEGLIKNAIAAQEVFDNNFIGPTAPIPPAVKAVPGNKTVTLYWDAEPSESSVDALTGIADFEGYRIYRSDDRGQTWGKATDNLELYPNGFIPVAEYDVINSPEQLGAIVVAHTSQISTSPIHSLGLADGSQPGDAEGINNSAFISNDDYHIIFETDSTFRVLNASQGLFLKYLDDLSAAVGFAVLDPEYTVLTDNPAEDQGLYRSGYPIYITGVFVEIRDAPGDPPRAGDLFLVDQRKTDPGKNIGLTHKWTDPTTLINGYEYWYTVAAYDRPDLTLGVPINENRPASVADAFDNDQTVAVIPQAPYAGFQEAQIDSTMRHTAGNSDVDGFAVELIDPRLVTGHTYEISFEVADGDKTYTVTNMNTGQIVLSRQPFYNTALDNARMFDGIRVIVVDVEPGINEDASGQIGTSVGGTITLDQWDLVEPGGLMLLQDYEFRFTSETWTYTDWDNGTPVTANFAIFDVTGGQERQITVEIFDDRGDADGEWDVNERIAIVNTDYTGSGEFEGDYPDDYGWRVRLATDDPDGVIDPGNVFRLITNKSITAEDRYQFNTLARQTDPNQAAQELAKIRVVPNPFIVTSGFDTVRDRHEVHFTRLPETCTIKIFTLTGELVRVIEHNRAQSGLNFARWDLKTEFGSEVAYGVYLYHITSPVGEHSGKLAIMR